MDAASDFAHLLVTLLAAYAFSGVAFAIPFVLAGAARVDSQARGAPLGFRLIVLPGAAALWPLLLARWIRSAKEPLP
jgi:hypothetical protein